MSYLRCLEKIDYLNQKIGQVIGQKKVYQMADDRIAKFGLQKVKHMLVNTAEAQIDTGRMIRALLSKTRAGSTEILNGIEVLNISDEADNVLISCAGNISFSCKKLIVATNGFARQLLPLEDVEPARAQVLVTEPIPDLKLKGTFHFDGGYYYFRNIGNRVLLGGARNSDFHAEATMEFGLTENIQSRLEELLKTMILPSTEFKIDIRWSGIMGVGPQKKSIVRATSKNVYCAVRMGGMGVAIGSLIGEDVANLVADQL
jgi:glycine/D-amino acid oxidase-like deaminating enzyme